MASVSSASLLASPLSSALHENQDLPDVLLPPVLRAVPNGTRRILLVDDDPDIRGLVKAFLQAEGYEVFSCSDAHRAMGLFRTRDDIDLLLTDLRMPDIDGLELAHALTAIRPGLPVMIMSGAVLDDGALQGLERSGWRFLPKPFLVPELLGAVHDLLASSPVQTEVTGAGN